MGCVGGLSGHIKRIEKGKKEGGGIEAAVAYQTPHESPPGKARS